MRRLRASASVAILLSSRAAVAQTESTPPAFVSSAEAPSTAPAASPPPDHDELVRHLAIGYFGTSLLPIAVPPAGTGSPPTGGTITAPNIGVRYWLTRRLGIDAGLGLGFSAGSETINSQSSASPTTFGFDLHAGLPLAVASSSHYVFEVVPEALFGYSTGSIATGAGQPSETVNGLLVNIGGRAGAELHFGFIGIPQLSLQASVGVYFSHSSFGWSEGANSASVVSNTLTTSVNAPPWAIFVNNISALYYL
jgi:hypothetical protein